MGISGFLKEVVALKKMDIAESQRILSLNSIRQQAEDMAKLSAVKIFSEGNEQNVKATRLRADISFLHALENNRPGKVGIIAEIKKASPSKGDIKADLDPAKYADEYTKAGACAISVLTEPHYFKGSLDDLKAVRQVTSLPVLRKDFTLSSYQIYEAKAAGADTILLIVAMLSKEQLRDYLSLSRELGMEPLVEINSEWEIDKTMFADARIIGINNRNLETLEVDLNVSKRVVPFLLNGEQIPVEASGISSSDDIQKGLDCKIFNFLVGESIVKADNTMEFIQSLVNTGLGGSHRENQTKSKQEQAKEGQTTTYLRPKMIKICGLTSSDEAVACVKAGADAIGFIFYPKSPRYIFPKQAAEITKTINNMVTPKNRDGLAKEYPLSDDVMVTGVFVDEDYTTISKIAKECSLKAVQLHGNEPPSLVRELAADGLIVIKALFAGREPHLDKAHLYEDAHAILVEYGKGELPGGNGESWNWELVGERRQAANAKEIKIILAGGVNPDNIKKAIETANPWGVDVSSGVELSPGKKDIDKVKKLIQQINDL